MKKIFIFCAATCLFQACKPSVNVTVPSTSGDAVFTTYLAIGNSLTAGYADNSLYVTGQLNSYPRRLWEQFSTIKDHGENGAFYQPLLHGDMGYPGPRLVMGYDTACDATIGLAPVNLPYFAADAEDAKTYLSPGPNHQLNNIGVPGIRISDYAVPGYAQFNPYAARFYRSTTESAADELLFRVNNLHPTFFTMWLGANDVLGYATAGGQGDGSGNAAPTMFGVYDPKDITPNTLFKTNYDNAVAIATSVGAKGALINIPDITTIPFFTTIPANGLYLSRQTQVDSLTAYYRHTLNIAFKLGYNYFIVRQNNGTYRQAVPGELILLNAPSDSFKCANWGSTTPIPQQYVLTTDEIQNIKNATTRYNEYIAQAATRNNLALVDMSAYLGELNSGITYNGIDYSAKFVSGGAFSLDGVHLTPRGYALVANRIIKAINEKYHSTVPATDPNRYNGVQFP